MPSQFFGLNIAYSGLLNSNAAINTTANNIANAETEGFSRQNVVSEASEALRVWTRYGCAGAGVDTLSIERIHDEFYDGKFRLNNSKTGEFEIKEYYMTQVEDYFRDDSTIEGFSTVFQKMMRALDEVQKNPGNESTKAQFIGMAGNTCEYFKSMSSNLDQIQKDVNSEIKLKVDEINSIAEQISTLNGQINVIEIGGGRANELRDKRTLLLDQLSKIVNCEAKEYPVTYKDDPDRKTGGNDFVVKIAGGMTLVDTEEYHQLTCVARNTFEKTNQSDVDGLYDVYWVQNIRTGALGDKFDLYNYSLGGELEGLIHMRDGNNGENFRGIVTDVANQRYNNAADPDDPRNGLKKVTISIDKKDAYLMDMDKCFLSDTGGIMKLGNEEFYYEDWTYNRDADGNVTFDIYINEDRNNTALTSIKKGKEAVIGADIDYQGIPYYQRQLNEWCRIYADAFNSILQDGYTSDGRPGVPMFVGDTAADNKQWQFAGPAYKKYENVTDDFFGPTTEFEISLSKDDDTYYQLTAKNFNVLTAMVNDSSLLATKRDQGAGEDEYANVKRLVDLATNDKVASYRGAASSEFLTCVLSDVALNTNNARVFKQNYVNIGNTIDNQRISISGVDNDDEAVNLIKYQNAYTMASKMIQTLTEIYDRLILETGV